MGRATSAVHAVLGRAFVALGGQTQPFDPPPPPALASASGGLIPWRGSPTSNAAAHPRRIHCTVLNHPARCAGALVRADRGPGCMRRSVGPLGWRCAARLCLDAGPETGSAVRARKVAMSWGRGIAVVVVAILSSRGPTASAGDGGARGRRHGVEAQEEQGPEDVFHHLGSEFAGPSAFTDDGIGGAQQTAIMSKRRRAVAPGCRRRRLCLREFWAARVAAHVDAACGALGFSAMPAARHARSIGRSSSWRWKSGPGGKPGSCGSSAIEVEHVAWRFAVPRRGKAAAAAAPPGRGGGAASCRLPPRRCCPLHSAHLPMRGPPRLARHPPRHRGRRRAWTGEAHVDLPKR